MPGFPAADGISDPDIGQFSRLNVTYACDATRCQCGSLSESRDRRMSGFAASTARGESTYDNPAMSSRLIVASEIRLSEIISALSVALDITQGNPKGHCMRSAIIGMRLAEELRLSTA